MLAFFVDVLIVSVLPEIDLLKLKFLFVLRFLTTMLLKLVLVLKFSLNFMVIITVFGTLIKLFFGVVDVTFGAIVSIILTVVFIVWLSNLAVTLPEPKVTLLRIVCAIPLIVAVVLQDTVNVTYKLTVPWNTPPGIYNTTIYHIAMAT